MNKKVTIILIITLFVLAFGLAAFSNVDSDEKNKENADLAEQETKEENVEGVVEKKEEDISINEEKVEEEVSVSLEFDVDQQYTDNDFLFTLKKYEIKDGVYKYKFEILNINDNIEELDYSLFKCVINQQSVDVNETGILSIEGKKKKNIEISCNSESEDTYLTYLSKMYDGTEDLVSFGKK